MASPVLWRDDNNTALTGGEGLRPMPGTTGIISVTLSASTQTLTLPVPAQLAFGGQFGMIRIAAGTQGVLYAFDTTGQSASYTSLANMTMLQANMIERVKVNSADTVVYVLQLGTAGTVQFSWLT